MRYLEYEVGVRLGKIAALWHSFYEGAFADGIAQEDMPEMTAMALSMGTFPRVFEQTADPANNLRVLYLLKVRPNMVVPKAAVKLSITMNADGTFGRASVGLNRTEGHTGIPDVLRGFEDRYRIEGVRMPMFKTTPIDDGDVDILRRLDANIPDKVGAAAIHLSREPITILPDLALI